MATGLNQHKALAMGKELNKSPSPVTKFKKGGAVKHDDAAMDKKMIKKMVKKGCVK
jgi:hypothetical protein